MKSDLKLKDWWNVENSTTSINSFKLHFYEVNLTILLKWNLS